MIYILSEQRLKNDFNDVINLQSSTIQQATRTAQDIYLRSIIGDYLLETLEDMILNDTLTGDYKLLIDNYCIPYLEYRTMAELQMSTFKINNAGANQVYDSNINTLSVEQVKYLEQQYINKASYYENRMTKYLIQSGIPEYKMKSGITNASTTITEQTGLFLGGVKTKTTNRTTGNKNSLVGAVRYDTIQNLSELQKQQARENIGVSANGQIDVNLDNYYTKEQVDTKLIPYITDNEVNLRLNSYYDKNTVNNLLNNLPIPEYTSELVKDDVYTKSEVNELIDNVTSGDIDLTNYYTKSEVDELISNSGGGSGEGNTTTVSISSNYITDIGLGGNDDLEFVYNEFFNTDKEFTDGIITYRGVQVNNYNSNGDTLTFTHKAIGNDNLVDSFKVDINKSITYKDFTVRTYPQIPTNEIWYRTNDNNSFYTEKEGIISNEYDSELGLFRMVFDGGVQITVHNELFKHPWEETNPQVTEVYFPNDGFVPYGCFKGCINLEKVELPFGGENNFNDGNDLNSTFTNCYSLKEIVIPINVYTIHKDTFQNCRDLKTIVFLGYPCSIPFAETIGTNVFRGKKIYYNEGYETPNEWQLMSEKYGFEIISVTDMTNVPINEYSITYTEQPENNININGGGGSGDTDLSNYYTKQETESLIENIDIPTATSDLELDNVYSKTQVDALIAEIPTFSGNYEDLTNKPSIYTQNEIDTLISNINVFSGDYNDLTNKPDVYTKTETDTAIQNAVDGIETFSGDYNDLTNKPDIYTKEQVYNKQETYSVSQIDTLISQIPTFSGDYNDLTNKPELFSGSYNDLSDKPTIPTATSQLQLDNVYNKSEIDLLFESVNTTLGDINNLLEQI